MQRAQEQSERSGSSRYRLNTHAGRYWQWGEGEEYMQKGEGGGRRTLLGEDMATLITLCSHAFSVGNAPSLSAICTDIPSLQAQHFRRCSR